MEQERIVIDGQRRLLSFCHVRDGDGTECKAPSCRNTLVPEVFQDPSTGKPKSYDEPNFFVFQKKQETLESFEQLEVLDFKLFKSDRSWLTKNGRI